MKKRLTKLMALLISAIILADSAVALNTAKADEYYVSDPGIESISENSMNTNTSVHTGSDIKWDNPDIPDITSDSAKGAIEVEGGVNWFKFEGSHGRINFEPDDDKFSFFTYGWQLDVYYENDLENSVYRILPTKKSYYTRILSYNTSRMLVKITAPLEKNEIGGSDLFGKTYKIYMSYDEGSEADPVNHLYWENEGHNDTIEQVNSYLATGEGTQLFVGNTSYNIDDGYSYYGTCNSFSDKDVYKYVFSPKRDSGDRKGYFDIRIDVPEFYTYEVKEGWVITVYDEEGVRQWRSGEVKNSNPYRSSFKYGEIYYIEVSNIETYTDSNNNLPYKITVIETEDNDYSVTYEEEHNNSREKAETINFNQIYRGFSWTAFDEDWYVVDRGNSAGIAFSLESYDHGNMMSLFSGDAEAGWSVSIYDENGKCLSESHILDGNPENTYYYLSYPAKCSTDLVYISITGCSCAKTWEKTDGIYDLCVYPVMEWNTTSLKALKLTGIDGASFKKYPKSWRKLSKLYQIVSTTSKYYQNEWTFYEYNNSMKAVELPTPSKKGYKFLGWYDVATGKKVKKIKNSSSSNLILEARWKRKKK